MPEDWREHKCNSPGSVNFMLSYETPLYFLGFWDILAFRVGLTRSVALPPAGWWETKDGWHCSFSHPLCFKHVSCISVESHTANPVLLHETPSLDISP